MPENLTPACDGNLSRKEFLTKLVQKAALAGSLVAAPKIVDKFLVPPALALNSTQHFHDSHAPLRNPSVGPTGNPSIKSAPSNTNKQQDKTIDAGADGWG